MRPVTERDVLYAVHGTPTYLGSVASGSNGACDNSTTSTPFSIASGAVVLLQAGVTAGYLAFEAAADASDAESLLFQPYEERVVVCPITPDNSTTRLSWHTVDDSVDVLNVFTLS